MTDKVKITGFGGSLRKKSFNRALLSECTALMPGNSELKIFDISKIPIYNQDDEIDLPKPVKDFKDAIRSSDAVLVVTPEYNYSIPGFLKNAIDYASRPADDNVFKHKPVALMSASVSILGGSRAQYHLRQVFVFLDSFVINKPEVFVTLASTKFDENLKLIDEAAKGFMKQLLQNLVSFTNDLKNMENK
ncbi:MAG: NAD(P)H-dependent oxidoreductase [Thermoplasmatales archaeon]|nr:NAD(P)H-dependent oxidoreductase [Thermoplasmatales archaeon]MCW6170603.1 NAD(P)H-dependent oxidoreductase [Thermoplasmatales archaeon]